MAAPREQLPSAGGKASGQGKKRARPLLEPGLPAPPAAADGQQQHQQHQQQQEPSHNKFARALGSVDFLTRERGVQALTRLLQRKTDITESDMAKLWKGLYFCFWHSDKVPVQTDLAERLANVTLSLSEAVAWTYWTTFITTMRREWFSIDRLRLDKFLMLVRKFVRAWLLFLKARAWRADLVEAFSSWLQAHVLLPPPNQPHRAAGLAYHLCDVFVPELRAALATTSTTQQQQQQGASSSAAAALPALTALSLLQPFIRTLELSQEEPLVHRVQEAVFQPLIDEAQGALEEQQQEQEEEEEEEQQQEGQQRRPPAFVPLLGSGAPLLAPGDLATALFDLGGAGAVRTRNRAALYGVSQALEKAARKRAKTERLLLQQQQQSQAEQQQAQPAQNGKRQQQQEPEVAAAEQHGGKGAKKRRADGAPVAGAAAQALAANGHAHAHAAAPAGLAPGASAARGVNGAADPIHHAQAGGSAAKRGKAAGGAATAPPVGQQEAEHAAGEAPAGTAARKRAGKPGAAAAAPPAAAAAPTPLISPAGAKGSPHHVSFSPTAATVLGQAPSPAGPAHSPAAAAGPKPAPAPQPPPAAAAGGGSAPVTPAAQTVKGTQQQQQHAATTAGKKRVQINLKKNLYFDFGGPVPDPAVRTPQSARSKGGILKKTSAFTDLPAKAAGGRKAARAKKAQQQRVSGGGGGMRTRAGAAAVTTPPGSAPPNLVTIRVSPTVMANLKQHQRAAAAGGKPAVVSPGSVARVRAADLFDDLD